VDGARAGGEAGEQVELDPGEVHLVHADPYPALGEVDLQLAEPQRGVLDQARRPFEPAQEGVDPRHQLPHAERLAQVVVRTDPQPDEQVGLAVPGREHEYGHRPVGLDPAAHLQPVEARQHDVENDHVRPAGAAGLDRRRPVNGNLHGEPLGPQPSRHRLSDRGLVVDDENAALAHTQSVWAGRGGNPREV